MNDHLSYLAQRDLEFLAEVRESSRAELDVMLRWQCAERWKRVAVMREIARRDGTALPVSEEF
jgi:hypothetical protein